jgi:hypothetical protein
LCSSTICDSSAVASAWACAVVAPGFSRAIVFIQPLPRASRRFAPVICGCIAMGTQAEVAMPRNEPRNSGGVTPITVIGTLLTVTSRPTTAGSAANLRCQ